MMKPPAAAVTPCFCCARHTNNPTSFAELHESTGGQAAHLTPDLGQVVAAEASLKVVADAAQVRRPRDVADGGEAAFRDAQQGQHARRLRQRADRVERGVCQLLPLRLCVRCALQRLQHGHRILQVATLHRRRKVNLRHACAVDS